MLIPPPKSSHRKYENLNFECDLKRKHFGLNKIDEESKQTPVFQQSLSQEK